MRLQTLIGIGLLMVGPVCRLGADESTTLMKEAVKSVNDWAEAIEKKAPPERIAALRDKATVAMKKSNDYKRTERETQIISTEYLGDFVKAISRLESASPGVISGPKRPKITLPDDNQTPPPTPESITPKLGTADLVKLLASPDDKTRILAANALAKIGPEAKSSLAALDKLLNDGNYFVSNAAKMAIVKIDSRKAMKMMIEKLDPFYDAQTRARAAEDLWDFGPLAKEAVPDLVRCFHSSNLDNRDSTMVFCAAHALAKIGPDALPALLKELKAENSKAVCASILALSSMEPIATETLPALRSLLKHKNPAVVEHAKEAILLIESKRTK